jgi:hypothetical protein
MIKMRSNKINKEFLTFEKSEKEDDFDEDLDEEIDDLELDEG